MVDPVFWSAYPRFVQRLIATFKLVRLVNCLLAMAAVIIGAHVTGGFALYGPFMASLAAFFVCAAGNVVNDLLDVESDRINHPSRVMVRETLTQKYAMVLAVILHLVGLFCAVSVNSSVLAATLIAIVLLAGYNFFLKLVVYLLCYRI